MKKLLPILLVVFLFASPVLAVDPIDATKPGNKDLMSTFGARIREDRAKINEILDNLPEMKSFVLITNDTTAASGDKLSVDTTSQTVFITLPAAPADGAYIYIEDPKDTWKTNSVTLRRNEEKILGVAADYTLTTGSAYKIVYTGANYGWALNQDGLPRATVNQLARWTGTGWSPIAGLTVDVAGNIVTTGSVSAGSGDFTGPVAIGAMKHVTSVAQLITAVSELSATGGTIDARGMTGTLSLTEKITLDKPNTTIFFGEATITVSGVDAVQSPFGANFLVTAQNVWLVGNGSTKFTMAAGANSNPIGFLHGATGGGVSGIELDGNKANQTGTSDDTFHNGIVIISSTDQGGVESKITIRDCKIHDFIHYGIMTYGDKTNGNLVENCEIYNNGKVGDANSNGESIYLNKGTGQTEVSKCKLYGNKAHGLHMTAVATDQKANKIVENEIYSNTLYGIYVQEETNVGSADATGQTGHIISKNHIYSNVDGIRMSTANDVGYLTNFTITENIIRSNSGYGILLLSSNHATNNTRNTLIALNQIFSNTSEGIGIAANVLDTTILANILFSNAGGQINDSGTRTQRLWNKVNVTDDFLDLRNDITLTRASGSSGTITLNQNGVASWGIQNVATTGVLKFGDGAVDAISITPSTGRVVVPFLVSTPIATASLPAAGAGMDGRILIEDVGVGDRNIIIYAGGQRFRVDGGAAF